MKIVRCKKKQHTVIRMQSKKKVKAIHWKCSRNKNRNSSRENLKNIHFQRKSDNFQDAVRKSCSGFSKVETGFPNVSKRKPKLQKWSPNKATQFQDGILRLQDRKRGDSERSRNVPTYHQVDFLLDCNCTPEVS